MRHVIQKLWKPHLYVSLAAVLLAVPVVGAEVFKIGRFSADVTIPLGHRCMGILPVKAQRIVDPLEARGFVLLGLEEPIVLVAIDWCEIRNDAYDRWRKVLAEAAETSMDRVLVCSLHQHDAPIADLGAEALLADVGLAGELHDVPFHEESVQRVADRVRGCLSAAQRVTHIGMGQAQVKKIASSRRIVRGDGSVSYARGSNSGSNAQMRSAPEGIVDSWLKTISFWNEDEPLVAVSAYATHPMSYYGRGEVSADFVGMARRRRQAELPEVLQIYVSGCSGDVTAGKYNDGSPATRPVLAARLHEAMRRAWSATERRPLRRAAFRTARLDLEFHEGEHRTRSALSQVLHDGDAEMPDRILAAMGLSSRQAIDAGRGIDFPCLDLGHAQLVLFPAEAFVGYQLMAQRMRRDSCVICIGYGQCWPGYVPTRSAFEDGFDNVWRWTARGAESKIRNALEEVLVDRPFALGRPVPDEDPPVEIARDVYRATDAHPRYSEGSIIKLDSGDLLYATTEFIGGGADDANARIVGSVSRDGGRTWHSRGILQQNVGRRNVMSVTLRKFRTPDSWCVAMFYLVKNSPRDLKVYLRLSRDDGRTFDAPILVTNAEGYHVMNNDRVAQLHDGRLLCPVAWTSDVVRDNHFVSFCYLSDDGGRTWLRGDGHVDLPKRGAMEPEIIERRDGTLLMLLRTQLGEIYASRSEDRGVSWSPAASWGVVSPEAPATLRRIPATGDWLLVWNPRHEAGRGHGGPRTPLRAAVSCDEGRTWAHHRDLETRSDQTFAYTSLTFHGDRVLLSYYVRDESSGKISSRFRSLPLRWFYARP